jgi:PHP family Zn ribbon phosphoesterase
MLDRYRLVSNSDAHSPGKLGREATTFDCTLDYFALRKALETGQGFVGTVEFFPRRAEIRRSSLVVNVNKTWNLLHFGQSRSSLS